MNDQQHNPHNNPDHIGGMFAPHEFADPEEGERFEEFDTYVELRVAGTPSDLALIEAFQMIRYGRDLSNLHELVLAIETNPYVRRKIKAALANMDIKEDLWTQNESANHLLRIIKDPKVRDTTRLNAIVHLNALCGYVQLDEGDTNKVQQTLADFERQHAAWVKAGGDTATAH